MTKAVNHAFFSVLTEESLWLLGFWVADGHATNAGLMAFSQADRRLVEKIKRLVGSDHKIATMHKGVHTTYQLAYTSKGQYGDVCRLLNRASLASKSLDIDIRPELASRHLFRGIIDGDGCLTWTGAKPAPRILLATGSLLLARSFSELVFDQSGISGCFYAYKNRNLYNVYYTGIKAKCLAYWLYHDSTVFLDRKRKTYLNYLNWTPNRIMSKSITPKMRQNFSHIIK